VRTIPAFIAMLLVLACAGQSFAFAGGDVPAPVDQVDMNGPGQSHRTPSEISGVDGNQGNDRNVGNAGGRSIGEEPGGDEIDLPR